MDTDEAFVLNLVASVDPASNAVFTERSYVSNHPTTAGWELRCPAQFIPNTLPFSQPFCTLDRQQEGLPMLNVAYADLGVKQMQLVAADASQSFTGFRPSSASLQPNDGYWRPEDDPDVGGGLVLVSQGPYTVVLMYSYDEAGNAAWSIAAGAFDANGLLQTELRHTSGGSPIGIDGKTSAFYTDQVQQLEIQLLGTELATFSVDGAPAKHIQNVNFGATLLSTKQLTVSEKPYFYPFPASRWLAIGSEDEAPTTVIDLRAYDPAANITPRPPELIGARGYGDLLTNPNQIQWVDFVCLAVDLAAELVNVNDSYCAGYFGRSDFSTGSSGKMYFMDIGVNQMRYYHGPKLNDIDRNSAYLQLYRLN